MHSETFPVSGQIARLAKAAMALLVLIVLLPLLIILVIAIALDNWGVLINHGRIIYSETRLGLGGRPFRIYKFRTLRHSVGGFGLVAPVGDLRITRLGAWLRHYHLDELPQLFNILRGDMNFVGPRPARRELWNGVEPRQRERALAFAPGLTSPASLRYICEDTVLAKLGNAEAVYRDIIFPAKVSMDIRYFESHKRCSDLKLIATTPLVLLSQGNDSSCRRRLDQLLQKASTIHSAG